MGNLRKVTQLMWQKRGILKKVGLAGFLFFLVKGLLWLAIPALLLLLR
jgi:hypothetical protein